MRGDQNVASREQRMFEVGIGFTVQNVKCCKADGSALQGGVEVVEINQSSPTRVDDYHTLLGRFESGGVYQMMTFRS